MWWTAFWWRLKDIWREPWADTKAHVRCFLGRHVEDKPGVMTGGTIWRFAPLPRSNVTWMGRPIEDISDNELTRARVRSTHHRDEMEAAALRHGTSSWIKTAADAQIMSDAIDDEAKGRGL